MINEESVTIVSGLPRSGTSLVMNMLHQGGEQIVSDENRRADIDNPKGYFELDRVKQLDRDRDSTWVFQCKGKVLKVVSPLLCYLPLEQSYKIVFVHRSLPEIMESQLKMVRRLCPEKDKKNDIYLEKAFQKHLKDVEMWILQNNIDTLHLKFNEIIEDSFRCAKMISTFLGKKLDHEKMLAVVDKELYRCRS